MSRVEFVPDHAGIAHILRSADMHEMVMDRTRAAAEFARRIAPVDTGDYQASIQAVDGGIGGYRRDRPIGLVVASVPYSVYVEADAHVMSRTRDIAEAGG
jgi:hypothetical protein